MKHFEKFHGEQSSIPAQNWPRLLNSEDMTRLILLQKLYKMGLVDMSPLDNEKFVDMTSGPGGEGVELPAYAAGLTGPDPGKNFSSSEKPEEAREKCFLIDELRRLEIYKIELRTLDRFERGILAKTQQGLETARACRLKYKRQWQREWLRKARMHRDQYKWSLKKKWRAEFMAKQQKENTEPEGEVVRHAEDEARHAEEIAEEFGHSGGTSVGPKQVPERPEVELEIVRVGPNPRLLQCQYRLLADTIKVHVWVKTNAKFRRGMKFRMREQEGSDWRYEGKEPRLPGRW